ncbi:hypothetical protein ACH3XW_23195 [Acanthocheilonema viteae]
MIRPINENEAIEMSNFDNIIDASSRFAATYNDSLILKLKIWWWNLTRKQRQFCVTSLLIFVILITFIFITVFMQHKHVDFYQSSTTAYTTTVTISSPSITIRSSTSTITTNTSIATSTMTAIATIPITPITAMTR